MVQIYAFFEYKKSDTAHYSSAIHDEFEFMTKYENKYWMVKWWEIETVSTLED